MNFDPFGADQTRIIRALERRIEVLEALVRNRPGAPVTQASGPLFLPNSSPSVPSGGCAIYAEFGELRVIEDDGSVRQIPPPSSPASAPNWPESFSSPASIVSPPSASDYNLLRSDCAGLHDDLRSVIRRGVDFGAWLDPS